MNLPVYPRYVPLAKIDTVFVAALMFIGLDALTTTFALLYIDGAGEANPVIAAGISTAGVVPVMSLKVLFGALLAGFLSYSAERGYPFRFMQRDWAWRRVPRSRTCVRAYRMLCLLAGLHGLVVVNNIIVIGVHA